VAVAEDVWARGRRARRRDRVVTATAVLSALLVLGGVGLALGLPGRTSVEPVSPDDVGAVPSVIHAVPERFGYFDTDDDTTWSPDVAESDLAIGRASVAFASGDHQPLPVVVTAVDGAYHLLRLPGWIGSSLAGTQIGGAGLALSPDGRRLAWGWYDRSSLDDDAVTAGVRVADLETGEVSTIPLEGGRGIAVNTVQWSPDGRWLLWQGQKLKRWEANRTSWQRNVAGRIAPGATTSEAIKVSRGGMERLAIGNDGTVSWTDGIGWSTSSPSGQGSFVTHAMQNESGVAASTSPTGRVVALATSQPGHEATFFRWEGMRATVSRPAHPRILRTRIPRELYPEGASVAPVGWLDDTIALADVIGADNVDAGGWTQGDRGLAVMSLDGATFDVITRIEGGDEDAGRVGSVTVAVDLLDPHKSTTRDFPEPEWPMSDERKVAISAGVVLALLAGVLVVRRLRRR
jgi:hypothetical protein